MPDYADAQPNDIEKYTKIRMEQLHEKYDNLAGVDKVYAAQQKLMKFKQLWKKIYTR